MDSLTYPHSLVEAFERNQLALSILSHRRDPESVDSGNCMRSRISSIHGPDGPTSRGCLMAWGKIDDKLYSSPKWMTVTKGGKALWVSRSLVVHDATDGRSGRRGRHASCIGYDDA